MFGLKVEILFLSPLELVLNNRIPFLKVCKSAVVPACDPSDTWQGRRGKTEVQRGSITCCKTVNDPKSSDACTVSGCIHVTASTSPTELRRAGQDCIFAFISFPELGKVLEST